MPASGEVCVVEQRRSGAASPTTLVTSAIVANVGAAARASQSAPVPVMWRVMVLTFACRS
jgi:hypothetical protein